MNFLSATVPCEQPNILFILTDQWAACATGFEGNPDVQTPALDALARQSIHCTNATASAPVCTPARASLITGQHTHRHGLIINDTRLDPGTPGLGKTLAASGWQTGWIGKWHIDGHGRSGHIPRERRQGFEFWKVLECSHNYLESPYYNQDDTELSWWSGPKGPAEYDAFAQTDAAIDFITGRDPDRDSSRPFASFLSLGPPHDPYHAVPQAYLDQYDPAAFTLRPNVPAEREADARKALHGYYAHCTALDECVARLDRALHDHGLANNTILVFTSDHGDSHHSHGYYGKQLPWDESVRIPFLIRWPDGLPAPRKEPATIAIPDFAPTLLGLCGCPIPETMQGQDFAPCLRGDASDPSGGAAYLQMVIPFGNLVPQGGEACREWRGLRTATHTYLRDVEGPWLLYDNVTDPFQMTNLVDDPSVADIQADLDARLRQRITDLGDKLIPGTEWAARFGYALKERNLVAGFADGSPGGY